MKLVTIFLMAVLLPGCAHMAAIVPPVLNAVTGGVPISAGVSVSTVESRSVDGAEKESETKTYGIKLRAGLDRD